MCTHWQGLLCWRLVKPAWLYKTWIWIYGDLSYCVMRWGLGARGWSALVQWLGQGAGPNFYSNLGTPLHPPPRFYHHNTKFHFFLLLQNLLVGPTTQLLLSLVILRKYLNCHSKNLAVSSSTVYTPSSKSQQTPKNHSKHIPSCRDLTNNSNWYFSYNNRVWKECFFFTSYNNRYLPLDMNNFRTMFSDLRKINDNDKK